MSKFEKICEEMIALQSKKNDDYGGSFSNNVSKYGLVATLIPLSNKLNRLESLVLSKSSPNMESLRDSYIDLACYAVMSIIELDNE